MSSNNSDGLMQDPYASPGSSGSLLPSPSPPMSSPDDFSPPAPSSAPADDLFLNIPSEKVPQPAFLFDENYDESFRRSWGERLTYHVGAAYSIGARTAVLEHRERGWRCCLLALPASRGVYLLTTRHPERAQASPLAHRTA